MYLFCLVLAVVVVDIIISFQIQMINDKRYDLDDGDIKPVSTCQKIKFLISLTFLVSLYIGAYSVKQVYESYTDLLQDSNYISEYTVAINSVKLCETPEQYGLSLECPLRMEKASGTFESMIWRKTVIYLRENRSWFLSSNGPCSKHSTCWLHLDKTADIILNNQTLIYYIPRVFIVVWCIIAIIGPLRMARNMYRENSLYRKASKRKQALEQQRWQHDNAYQSDVSEQLKKSGYQLVGSSNSSNGQGTGSTTRRRLRRQNYSQQIEGHDSSGTNAPWSPKPTTWLKENAPEWLADPVHVYNLAIGKFTNRNTQQQGLLGEEGSPTRQDA